VTRKKSPIVFSMGAESRVARLLSRCGTENTVMPPTQLYNEGWMLRLVLDWFSEQSESEHDLGFQPGSRWYSEALLPSKFFAKKRGDSRAEGWTNADGIVGHFQLRSGGRGDIELTPSARQMLVIEAKLGSGLSSGVKNAPTYNQAARNVACLCHVIECSGLTITDDWRLGFYILAPVSRINEGAFGQFLDLEGQSGIKAVVAERVKCFTPELDRWHAEHFLGVLSRIRIQSLSWESVIAHIQLRDPARGSELLAFYAKCLIHNRIAAPSGD
jgi:hypothetical protein